jgi:hypothetical protein
MKILQIKVLAFLQPVLYFFQLYFCARGAINSSITSAEQRQHFSKVALMAKTPQISITFCG